MICVPNQVHISRTVGRLLRNRRFEVTFDTAFADVFAACAEPRPGHVPLTWITPEVMQAYAAMHSAGLAHSVEVWNRSGDLAGGLYGVAIGKAFFIESMFARQPHASKIGLITLSCHLDKWGFLVNDAKRDAELWRSLGFSLIPRAKFNALLKKSMQPTWEGGSLVDRQGVGCGQVASDPCSSFRQLAGTLVIIKSRSRHKVTAVARRSRQ
jgi:leucyl/phenylalanyl-tRNA--protein transferase